MPKGVHNKPRTDFCERDAAWVREYLSYDPETGIFRWLKPPRARRLESDIAGTRLKTGYIMIGVRGRRTQSENCFSYGLPKHNTSGVRGVYFDGRRSRWNAEIIYRGKKQWLGSFPTLKEAREVRQNKARELFGAFARGV